MLHKKIINTLILGLLLATSMVAKGNSPEPQALPSPQPGLKYFGFVGVDCGLDDPHDTEVKTNYLDEIQAFTNLAHICVFTPEEPLAERLQAFRLADVEAIVHLEFVLFAHTADPATGTGMRLHLRADANARWQRFLAVNGAAIRAGGVAALYIADEPLWNGLSYETLKQAIALVKQSFPEIPTAVVEAYPVVDRLRVPPQLDWIGFDRYDSLDPANDPRWLKDHETVRAARTRPDQKILVIASTQWLPFYEADAGVKPRDMEAIVRSYYQVAASDPDVIALIGYSWAGGLDGPEHMGARNLPANMKKLLREMGGVILATPD